MFDVCIVGAGAMGSAAAYHLSKLDPTGYHCLIGPSEPETKEISSDRSIYGCHYDEGRITRVIASLDTEHTLAFRSTLDTLLLEEESGEKIFKEVGVAVFGNDSGRLQQYNDGCDTFCEEHDIPRVVLDGAKVNELWPYVHTNEGDTGRFVHDKSGWISIRNLVRACQSQAVRRGVTYKDDVAVSITKDNKDNRDGGDGKDKKDEDNTCFTIVLKSGEIIKSRKVILAAGSFTNFNNLIDRKLELYLKGHTVLKLEIEEKDVPELSSCPSMIHFFAKDDYVYLLPPIRYPNNKTYFKIGHSVFLDCTIAKDLTTSQEVKDWYCQDDSQEGSQETRDFLMTKFKHLFPEVDIISSHLDFCVMALTATGRQYVGFHEKGLLVMTGGNGKSAKMAMELGKMGVRAILAEHWDYDLNEQDFRVVYEGEEGCTRDRFDNPPP